MSAKKVIIMTVSISLALGIIATSMLAIFNPKVRQGYVRPADIDKDTIENAVSAKKPTDLTNLENLLRLQLELDKVENYTMTKESSIKANAGTLLGYTTQSVYDTKVKKGNTIDYTSIQVKGEGTGAADKNSPNSAGIHVVFDGNSDAVVTETTSVTDKDNYQWANSSITYNKTDYISKYGNWGNIMTDYLFSQAGDIANSDEKSIQYDATTDKYALTVTVNASAAAHYISKIVTLGSKKIMVGGILPVTPVKDAIFKDNCAKITFTFDKNWKLDGYTITDETYQTEGATKTTTTATHIAKFYY